MTGLLVIARAMPTLAITQDFADRLHRRDAHDQQ